MTFTMNHTLNLKVYNVIIFLLRMLPWNIGYTNLISFKTLESKKHFKILTSLKAF